MKHFKNVCKVFIVIWILLQFQSCEKETEVLVSKYDMYNHLSSKIKQIITEIDFDNIDYNLLKTINSSDFYKKENDAQLQKAVILFDEYSKIHKQFELTFGVNELQLALNKAFLENTKKLTETNQTNTEKRSEPELRLKIFRIPYFMSHFSIFRR